MRALIFWSAMIIVGAIDKEYQQVILDKFGTQIIVGLCLIFDAMYTYKKLKDL